MTMTSMTTSKHTPHPEPPPTTNPLKNSTRLVKQVPPLGNRKHKSWTTLRVCEHPRRPTHTPVKALAKQSLLSDLSLRLVVTADKALLIPLDILCVPGRIVEIVIALPVWLAKKWLTRRRSLLFRIVGLPLARQWVMQLLVILMVRSGVVSRLLGNALRNVLTRSNAWLTFGLLVTINVLGLIVLPHFLIRWHSVSWLDIQSIEWCSLVLKLGLRSKHKPPSRSRWVARKQGQCVITPCNLHSALWPSSLGRPTSEFNITLH